MKHAGFQRIQKGFRLILGEDGIQGGGRQVHHIPLIGLACALGVVDLKRAQEVEGAGSKPVADVSQKEGSFPGGLQIDLVAFMVMLNQHIVSILRAYMLNAQAGLGIVRGVIHKNLRSGA